LLIFTLVVNKDYVYAIFPFFKKKRKHFFKNVKKRTERAVSKKS